MSQKKSSYLAAIESFQNELSINQASKEASESSNKESSISRQAKQEEDQKADTQAQQDHKESVNELQQSVSSPSHH